MNPIFPVLPQAPSPVPTPCMVAGQRTLSMAQVGQLSGLTEADLLELVDYGVLVPLVPLMPDSVPLAFPVECVMLLQRADRLRRDLALDEAGFALAVMFVSQITVLEAQVRDLCAPPGECRSDT